MGAAVDRLLGLLDADDRHDIPLDYLRATQIDRWGGVITGDQVHADYGDRGRPGPTINPDIVRYKDLPGGDYIARAGAIDAHVRGIA